jgi:hypothetical protein
MTTTDESAPTGRPEFIEATHTSVVIAGVLLAVGGWAGLVGLVSNTYPTVDNRWAFFALFHVALTGTALPFVQFLNKRFARPGMPPITAAALVRQATWVGLFGTACAWLRIPRLLSWGVAAVLVLALVVIEILMRLRESGRYRRGRYDEA